MSSRKKPHLTEAELARIRREAVLRRQGVPPGPVIILGGPTEEVPEEILKMRLVREDYRQPEYPGLRVDPATCREEIAWIRMKVAEHKGKLHPVPEGPLKITQALRHASYWLRAANREPLVRMVNQFVQAKQARKWDNHHQNTWAFNQDGLVCDGLKRLIAGILSNEAEYVGYIWFNDPTSSFASMDIGQGRTAQGNLKMAGIAHPDALTRVIRQRYRIEHGGLTADQKLVHDIAEKLANDGTLDDAFRAADMLRKATGIAASSAAFAYWVIQEQSRYVARLPRFWELLVRGSNLSDDSPLWVVRERLRLKTGVQRDSQGRLTKSTAHQYLFQTQQTAWLIMAFNLWRLNRSVPNSHWPRWTEANDLPVVDADDAHGREMQPLPSPRGGGARIAPSPETVMRIRG